MDIATTTNGEGKRVLALVAGAATFCVGLVILAVLTDWILPWLTSSDGRVSTLYVVAWLFGSAFVSGAGVEIARLISPYFNRVGLIALMVTPVVALALIMAFASGGLSGMGMAIAFSFIGTAMGLSRTFSKMPKAENATPQS